MIDNLKELRNWFKKNRADLPWRPAHIDDFRDPYIVWISETMLQQTQVTTVVEYFLRWLKKFPTVQNLAIASEQEVFSLWQGLGYYSRARNILRTAKLLAEKYNGQFPTFRKDLENLPGIGAYTAGAILSMAYHKNEAILDGNLIRIFSRYYLIDFLPIDKVGRDIYWQHAIQIASQSKAYIHNEALMELGRTVCKPKNPDCNKCPLKKGCMAFVQKKTELYPPSKKSTFKNWNGIVLVVESIDKKILVVKGGHKFLVNQFTLPHYEAPLHIAVGLIPQTEYIIDADHVSGISKTGSFTHGITNHKITCNVLHVQLNYTAKEAARHIKKNVAYETEWINKSKIHQTISNTFSLKALLCCTDKP